MSESEDTKQETPIEKPRRNYLRWEGSVSVSDAFSFIAVVVSMSVAYLAFYEKEDLTLNILSYIPFRVDETATISINAAIANNGTQPAIVSKISLLLESPEDGPESFMKIPWREFSISEANRVPLPKLLYVEPILVPSSSLIAKTLAFQFEVLDRYIGSDGKVQMALCIEFIDSDGQRIVKRHGTFNMYIVDDRKTEFDNVPFTRISLLPNSSTTDGKCAMP